MQSIFERRMAHPGPLQVYLERGFYCCVIRRRQPSMRMQRSGIRMAWRTPATPQACLQGRLFLLVHRATARQRGNAKHFRAAHGAPRQLHLLTSPSPQSGCCRLLPRTAHKFPDTAPSSADGNIPFSLKRKHFRAAGHMTGIL